MSARLRCAASACDRPRACVRVRALCPWLSFNGTIVTAFRVLVRNQDEVGRLGPREARNRYTTSSMHSPARSEVPISHDVSERLVEGAHQSDDAADLSSPANEDTQIQGATAAPPASTPSFFSRLAGIVGTGRTDNVTSRHPARDPSGDNLHIPVRAMSPQVQLEQLQLATAIAELAVRKALAERQEAEHLRVAAEHRLATKEVDWKMRDAESQRSRSASPRCPLAVSPSPRPSPSPPAAISPTRAHSPREFDTFTDLPLLLQWMERSEERHRLAAAEQHALLTAQLAALSTANRVVQPPAGFTPSKAFADLPSFSGARDTLGLHPWSQLFRARANLLGTSETNAARELCLKLTGPALQSYGRGFTADTSPTFAAVVAHLSKDFIQPYQGAARWAAYYRYKRPAGSSGKEAKQQLQNARQECLDDNIPVDNLSPAEHMFYIYQLSLSSQQSAHFLATLSSNPLASDDYLRSLAPGGEACRRESLAEPQNSAERTACFERRVTLIEAFLDHDNGDAGRGGTGRAAVTTGFPDEQEVPLVAQNPNGEQRNAAASPPFRAGGVLERESRLNLARGDRIKISTGAKPTPPPEYMGPNAQHESANKKEFLARQARGSCFACPNGEVRRDQHFLDCPQHGKHASTKQRTDVAHRVPGALLPPDCGTSYGPGY